jgi:D-beta-D-heptose 7-phosphate kinase/D-beta-D-heptose 1-phosphate adenosyltransferase
VERISPEAPVPVNKVVREAEGIGGAGNVAANLALLGARVYMGGMRGMDAAGERLGALLAELSIDASGVAALAGCRTTTKLRVIGAGQQMLRLDFEKARSLSPDEERQLLAWCERLAAGGLSGIILSDYAKGVLTASFCQKAIALSKRLAIPLLVDPKGDQWEKYRGAALATPNVKELGEAVRRSVENSDREIEAAAREALSLYELGAILVTRSEKGMTYVSAEEVFTVQATAREVYDVSGAGDTVAAVFLAAVAGGLSPVAAASLANEAAGIVVARAGTYAIRREDLLDQLQGKAHKLSGSLTREEGLRLIASWRRLGERIVFTNGCFDILHPGHIEYLTRAAQLGERLVIGLNSDDSVRRLKGESRPLVGEKDRARMLSALSAVDAVVLFEEDTPATLIAEIRPDVLVKGGDYRPEEVVGREYAGQVRIIDFVEGYSTTNLVTKIAKLAKEGKL